MNTGSIIPIYLLKGGRKVFVFDFRTIGNEILDDMKAIKYWAYMRASFVKSLVKTGVHIAGYRLDCGHPFHADMVYEIIDNLFFLADMDPKNVDRIHNNDMGHISIKICSGQRIKLIYFLVYFSVVICHTFHKAYGYYP